MRIGYPTINTSIGCTASRTFRLKNFSPERFREIVAANLACLRRTLEWNVDHDLRFFRISSDLIPFASHEVCTLPWQEEFAADLAALGALVIAEGMRISMHPDQFVLINALDEGIVERSVAELVYHAQVLDGMDLDSSHKLQIHVGGVYGDKAAAMDRFAARHALLPLAVQRRVVIENDDRLYTVADCVDLSNRTGAPVLFDNFHHGLLNAGEPVEAGLAAAMATWTAADGVPITDYSSQAAGGRLGSHSSAIDLDDFAAYLQHTHSHDFDIMLEIKDKEVSALAARQVVRAIRGE